MAHPGFEWAGSTTDADLYERLREAKFHTTITRPTVDTFLAAQALRRRAEILTPRTKRLGQALAELPAWAQDEPVEVVRPDGRAMCCLRLAVSRCSDDAISPFYARLARHEVRGLTRGRRFIGLPR